MSATLVLTHGNENCLIDDISATGAHLRVNVPIAIGSTAILTFHELRIYAAVVWCRKGEVGLRFEKTLPVEDMEGMLWITQNREMYERLCLESRAEVWSTGFGD